MNIVCKLWVEPGPTATDNGGCLKICDSVQDLRFFAGKRTRQAMSTIPARLKAPGLPGFICERYTWEQAAEQLIAVYADIVNKKST
jgi:hypothetical protein